MKKLALLFIAAILVITANAQRKKSYTEFGPLAGVNYYIGDVNTGKHFYGMGGALGAIYKHNFNTRVAIRGTVAYGKVEAHDKDQKKPSLVERGLSFHTNIFEVSIGGEFSYYPYEVSNQRIPITPYAFFGVSMFKFNPKAFLGNEEYELQPLRTEGQGTTMNPEDPYSLTSIAIPFGLGLKMNVGPRFSFAIESGLRYTFTDYLDDVSTVYPNYNELTPRGAQLSRRTNPKAAPGRSRGNPNDNDWFNLTAVTLTYRIGAKTTCPSWN